MALDISVPIIGGLIPIMLITLIIMVFISFHITMNILRLIKIYEIEISKRTMKRLECQFSLESQ